MLNILLGILIGFFVVVGVITCAILGVVLCCKLKDDKSLQSESNLYNKYHKKEQ